LLQIAGVLTNDDPTLPSNWRPVWLISSSIVLTEAVFYVVFASGEVQPWNTPQQSVKEGKEKMGESEKENGDFLKAYS
jgi:hypothetical protein